MKKIIIAVMTALALWPAPAIAATPAHGCHVKSVSTQHQTRNVTGMTMGVWFANRHEYRLIGNGVQQRDVTTITTKCKGKTSTTTTATEWTYIPPGHSFVVELDLAP